MLIAICGIDGSGKTTQIELLKKYFNDEYQEDVLITKQPTNFYRSYNRFRSYVNRESNGPPVDILYELALLSATDKLKHYSEEILPNKEKIIISDRYVFSAYSYFLARGISDIEWLKEINKYLPLPDITIYIDILPNIAYERIVNRDGRYTKKEETDMKILSKVRDNFISQPWGVLKNYYIVNSNEKTIIEVHKEIIDIISKYREDIWITAILLLLIRLWGCH